MTDTPVKSAWKLIDIFGFCLRWLKGLVLQPIATILFLFAQLFRLLALGTWRIYVNLSLGIKPSPSALPDLSPTDEPEHVDICVQALESYLQRPKVKSIAITGPYSGGKTSFIQYFFKYRPYRVQYISLATLLDGNSDESAETKDDDGKVNLTQDRKESLCIEQSILQQLVQPSHRDIFSRYVSAALFIFFVAVGFHIFDLFTQKTPVSNFLHMIDQDTLHAKGVFWVSVVFLSLLIIVIKDFFLIIRSYRLKKLSIAKGEFELVDKSSTSLLNLHLGQIREHFEHNPTDVVVFEDLDRFGRTDIFIKLREINKLINDARLPIKAPIRFIFAISDDVFKESRDRTKFFDAIVSLVPVANTHKAYALFMRLVEGKLGSLLEKLEPVIEQTAHFINDMRLINNIIADFSITFESLKLSHNEPPDPVKLFSYTLYKNVYPEDFSLLHEKKGVFYYLTCDATLMGIRGKVAKALKQRKDELEKDIEKAKEEQLSSIKDLNYIYFLSWLLTVYSASNPISAISGISMTDYIKNALPEADLSDESEPLTVNLNHGRQKISFVSGSDLTEYRERRKRILTNDKINHLREQIALLEKEIQQIHSLSLQQLFEMHPTCIQEFLESRKNRSSVPELSTAQSDGTGEIKSIDDIPGLLCVLLRRGYLDTRYKNYTTHCHDEDPLSGSDRSFVTAVSNSQVIDPILKLQKLRLIQSEFLGEDYRSPSIINFDFIEFLLEDSDYTHLDDILGVFKGSENQARLIYDCLEHITKKKLFIRWLAKKWMGICSDLVSANTLSSEETRTLLLKIIPDYIEMHGEDKLAEEREVLTAFFEPLNYIFDRKETVPFQDFSVFSGAFAKMGIRFQDLTQCPLDNKQYIDECIDNNLFEVNEKNVRVFAHHYCKLDCDASERIDVSILVEHAPQILGLRLLREDVVVVAGLVIDNVFDMSNVKHIVKVINNKQIISALLHKFLEQIKQPIPWSEDIQEVETVLPILLETNKVEIDWGLMRLLKEHNVLNTYHSFANEHVMELCQHLDGLNEEIRNKYWGYLPVQELDDNVFTQYIQSFEFKWTDIAEFQEKQLQLLFDNDCITPGRSSYESIKERHPNLILTYLVKYHDALLEDDDSSIADVESNLILPLLSDASVSSRFKARLFNERQKDLLDDHWNRQLLEYIVSCNPQPQLALENLSLFELCGDDSKEATDLIVGQLEYLGDNVEVFLTEKIDNDLAGIFNKKTQCTLGFTDRRQRICEQLKVLGKVKSYEIINRENKQEIFVKL